MKRVFALFLCSAFFFNGSAQNEDSDFFKTGLIRSQGTIATGIMTQEPMVNIYVHGTLALYLSEHVAFFSDTYYFIDTQKGEDKYAIEQNHSTFSGLSFHLKKEGRFDPFASLQPGVALVEIGPGPNYESAKFVSQQTVSPLIGIGVGANYFVSNFFHFFLMAKYTTGTYFAEGIKPIGLGSVRISGGLGLNFRVFRPEQKKSE